MKTPKTLREYLRFYVLHHVDLAELTGNMYGYSVNSFQRFAGSDVRLRKLTDELLLSFIQRRLKEVGPKTVKRERGDVLMLWKAAARQKLCKPPGDIPSIRLPRTLPTAWYPEEARRLVDATRGLSGEMRGTGISRADWWTSLFYFLFDSLARISAALAVTPLQVNLDHRYAVLSWQTSKTKVEQAVRLHERTVEAIRVIHDTGRDLIWPYPYNRRRIWLDLKRILRKAGLPSDRYHMFHATRRTTATVAAARDGMAAAERLLGHNGRSCLKYYIDPRQLPTLQAPDVLAGM